VRVAIPVAPATARVRRMAFLFMRALLVSVLVLRHCSLSSSLGMRRHPSDPREECPSPQPSRCKEE